MSRYENETRYKKKIDKFYSFFIILLLIAIVIMWFMVWGKVKEYEKGSTKYLMENLVLDLSSEYEGKITYKRASTVDDGILYNIYQDEEQFATVVLNEREEKGMLGFSLYDIGEMRGSKGITIYANPEDDISIAGLSLDNINTSGEAIFLPRLKELAEYKSNKCPVPKYSQYVIENQYTTPIIVGKNIIILDEAEGSLIAHKMPTSLQDELKVWCYSFFARYTNYLVFGKGFSDIEADIYSPSPIYTTLKKIAWYWDYYYDYELTLNEINYSDFIQYTDDIVSLRVKYSYNQKLGKIVKVNRPDINVYLYNNDGVWQVIEMEISEWSE